MEIREYGAHDAGPVAALIAATVQVSNVHDYPPHIITRVVEHYTAEQMERYRLAGRHIVVAESAGRLVGTASLEGNELFAVYVRPSGQGSGAGRALIAALEAEAARRGHAEVVVHSSVTAVNFYRRCGYEQSGPSVDEDGAAHVPMRKMLESRVT